MSNQNLDKALELHEGRPGLYIPAPGNAMPNLSYQYRQMTLNDTWFQWVVGEWLKFINTWYKYNKWWLSYGRPNQSRRVQTEEEQ
jgi:hypothetical protein